MEDFNLQQGSCKMETGKSAQATKFTSTAADRRDRLLTLGLGDLDIESCDTSTQSKAKPVELIVEYDDIFPRDPLDCGEAKGFVHHIHLTDDQPFPMPYKRVPPAHYQQLRQVFTDMEEKGIICKSISEYVSPLVCLEEGWWAADLHRFHVVKCTNPEGCPPTPSPS